MKMKRDKMSGGYSMYEDQHNPNAGENSINYASSRTAGSVDKSGVESGLSYSMKADVKNAETVCQAQRPDANSTKSGGFRIGT